MKTNSSKIQKYSLRLFALLIPYYVIYYTPLPENNPSKQSKILWKYIYLGIIFNCTILIFLVLK